MTGWKGIREFYLENYKQSKRNDILESKRARIENPKSDGHVRIVYHFRAGDPDFETHRFSYNIYFYLYVIVRILCL